MIYLFICIVIILIIVSLHQENLSYAEDKGADYLYKRKYLLERHYELLKEAEETPYENIKQHCIERAAYML